MLKKSILICLSIYLFQLLVTSSCTDNGWNGSGSDFESSGVNVEFREGEDFRTYLEVSVQYESTADVILERESLFGFNQLHADSPPVPYYQDMVVDIDVFKLDSNKAVEISDSLKIRNLYNIEEWLTIDEYLLSADDIYYGSEVIFDLYYKEESLDTTCSYRVDVTFDDGGFYRTEL